MTIFDSHCHLQLEQFDDDREDVYQRARSSGVEEMIVIGIDTTSSLDALSFCEDHEGCYPTAGLHPHEADFIYEQTNGLRKLLNQSETVAVGETGLDFHKEYSPRTQQEESLATHLNWAIEFEKPLIFHCRDANETLIEILEDNMASLNDAFGERPPGVVHCFSGNREHLQTYQDMGFYVSFSGIITLPNSDEVQDAATAADPDQVLVETDSPFIAPAENRGKRNEPAFITETVEQLASLMNMEPDDLAQKTTENARDLFLSGS